MSDPLRIELAEPRVAYSPGETLRGEIRWDLPKPPKRIELRLYWHTTGKGTTDSGLVETISFDHPRPADRRSFQLQLPMAPWSFRGQLIELHWTLGLAVVPGKQALSLNLVIAPGGQAIELVN